MFNNSRTHQDEYIREYAFEPELLINREEYLREEERARKLPSTPVRLRWDEAIAKQKEQQKRTASQSENASDDKNQIEFEIEAFYYVSPWPCFPLSSSLLPFPPWPRTDLRQDLWEISNALGTCRSYSLCFCGIFFCAFLHSNSHLFIYKKNILFLFWPWHFSVAYSLNEWNYSAIANHL